MVTPTAPVPFPYNIPYWVKLLSPVPPFGTVTALVSARLEAFRFGIVTKPLPKVTGLFVVVLIERAPVEESITGFTAFNETLLLKVALPVTASVLLNVAPPVTPNVPPMVELPFAASVVNAPVLGVDAPIGVPLIEPPVIAAPDEAKLFAVVAPVKVFALLPV